MVRIPKSHLTYEERCQIYACIASGISKRAIARLLGVSHVTICKELTRNSSVSKYRPQKAHELSVARRKGASGVPKKMTHQVTHLIGSLLASVQASPEQISGILRKEHNIRISTESIYRYIWTDKHKGGKLYLFLRRKSKKYNKRSSLHAGRGLIPNRVDIDQRPAIVEKKKRVGDFEIDTIVGSKRKAGIVTIVDRASKYVFLRFVPKLNASCIEDAVCKALACVKGKMRIHTITADNGKEFACHESIASRLNVDFYFAKPYQAWQRGLCEHTNGLVRQYLPKGTDFTKLTQKELDAIAYKLNYRPRKILNYNTPIQIFRKSLGYFVTGNFRG